MNPINYIYFSNGAREWWMPEPPAELERAAQPQPMSAHVGCLSNYAQSKIKGRVV